MKLSEPRANRHEEQCAVPEARPAWEAISEEILCPLCDYNLRGLIESRCPECGYRFEWPDLLDPSRRLHPYLFEHHPERSFWSFRRTVLGALGPRRFWRSLHPAQPSRPRRLALYWVLTTVGHLLALGLFCVAITARAIDRNMSYRGSYTSFFTMPDNAESLQVILNQYGSLQAFLDQRCPTDPLAVAGQLMWNGSFLEKLVAPIAVLLAWPWLTWLALLIFQASMRRARVKPMHVMRCAVYSFDVLFWLGLAQLAMVLFWLQAMGGSYRMNDLRRDATIGMYLVVALVGGYRLYIAYRRYLKFHRPLATVLASQCIVVLVVANILLAIAIW